MNKSMSKSKSTKQSNHNHRRVLKYKICVSGSADTSFCHGEANEKAKKIGRLIAEHNMILVTGATTGIPYWAAKGAKDAGVWRQAVTTAKSQ